MQARIGNRRQLCQESRWNHVRYADHICIERQLDPYTSIIAALRASVDDFAIRQEWWTGDALPDAKVVRRELAGVPKVEVVGLSKEKVEEIFWDTITQVRADLAGIRRK